jgi:hypothetical protein
LINADHRDTDRASATALEFAYLMVKVVLHPVNLLDHGLCQDLHFDTNLDCSYRSSGHQIVRICERRLARNEFTESSIPTPGGNAVALVLSC